jgi:hypothetical protein
MRGAVSVKVSDSDGLLSLLHPGARVDVLVVGKHPINAN